MRKRTTYEAIVKGQNIPKPGIPESFKVLIKELQSLGLDVKVLDKDDEEIDLKQTFDDDDDMGLQPVDDEAFSDVTVEDDMEGFGVEDVPEEAEELESSEIFDLGLDSAFDDEEVDE